MSVDQTSFLQAATLADAPPVAHAFFTRRGGVSGGIYASRNCGLGSSDEQAAIVENRERCRRALAGAGRLVTIYQVHSCDVLQVEEPWEAEAAPKADAMVTDRPGIALGILTADCAPILFVDPDEGIIGAAHAGWKGAFGGIAVATVAAMERLGADRSRIRAAIGPCIGRASYEVGPEFRDRFLASDPAHAAWFGPSRPDRPDHAMFDLPGFAAAGLEAAGVGSVEVLPHDTAAEEGLFFSYRRATLRGEPDYGRQMSAIVLRW
jgi:YfiH family protein